MKCVFIDPPYNTKSAFEHYDDNLEHSQWLSLMYPRLELLRDLLSEDASIWVTIDDNEGHYLKALMDEPTSTDRFYPDFVVQFADGRILVVEYKGAHLFNWDDAREKRDIGEVWAAASDKRCLFVMITDAVRAGKSVAIQLREALR